MRVIELNELDLSLERLLEIAQEEDVLFTRAGHPLGRLQRFTQEDWEDWLFEHDPAVILQVQAARERMRRGEGVALEEVVRQLHLDSEDENGEG